MLLGRHVARRADDRAVRGERRAEIAAVAADLESVAEWNLRERVGHRVGERVTDRAREPEVHHAWPTLLADDDVARLEVAVHEPVGMRGGEATTRLHEHRDHAAPVGMVTQQPTRRASTRARTPSR